MIFYIFFIIIGFVLLMKGADYLVNGSINIANKFKISTLIIGLTIVAVGTSMPELIVSITASVTDHSDISIGNVIGSNMANLLLVLGICSLIRPIKFELQTEMVDSFIVLYSTLLLLFFGNNDNLNLISRFEGVIFILCTILFVFYTIIISKNKKNSKEFDDIKSTDTSIFKSIFNIFIGIVALKIGGDLVIDYASKIASLLGLGEKLISVTIISFGTSLPELITCVTASIKGETNMAIGNVLGSQILNIFLIVGITSLISPISYSILYNIDLYFLILGTIFFILFPFEGKKHHMTKSNGYSFLVLYIIYISYHITKIGL